MCTIGNRPHTYLFTRQEDKLLQCICHNYRIDKSIPGNVTSDHTEQVGCAGKDT